MDGLVVLTFMILIQTNLQPGRDPLTVLLSVVVGVMGFMVAISGYFIKRRMEAYDKHLEACTERAISTGRMEQKIANVIEDISDLRDEVADSKNTMTWIGNCIYTIGVKDGVDLPKRPG